MLSGSHICNPYPSVCYQVHTFVIHILLCVTRFTHIVVDRVHGKHHQTYEVVFVATLEGRLKKMARIPGEDDTCTIGNGFCVIA